MTRKRYHTEFRFVQDFPCRSKWRLWLADLLIHWSALIMGAYDIEIDSNIERIND